MRRKYRAVRILAAFSALAGGVIPFTGYAENVTLPSVELNFKALEKLKVKEQVRSIKKTAIRPEAELKNSSRIVTPELKPATKNVEEKTPKAEKITSREIASSPVSESMIKAGKPDVVIKGIDKANKNISSEQPSSQESKPSPLGFFSGLFSKKEEEKPAASNDVRIQSNTQLDTSKVVAKKVGTSEKPKATVANKPLKTEEKVSSRKLKSQKEEAKLAKKEKKEPKAKIEKFSAGKPADVAPIVPIKEKLPAQKEAASKEISTIKIQEPVENMAPVSAALPKENPGNSVWDNFLERAKNNAEKAAENKNKKLDAKAIAKPLPTPTPGAESVTIVPVVIDKEADSKPTTNITKPTEPVAIDKVVENKVEKPVIDTPKATAPEALKVVESAIPPVVEKLAEKNVERPINKAEIKNIKAPPVPAPLAITPALQEKMEESSNILFGKKHVEDSHVSADISSKNGTAIATPQVPSTIESKLEMVVLPPTQEEINKLHKEEIVQKATATEKSVAPKGGAVKKLVVKPVAEEKRALEEKLPAIEVKSPVADEAKNSDAEIKVSTSSNGTQPQAEIKPSAKEEFASLDVKPQPELKPVPEVEPKVEFIEDKTQLSIAFEGNGTSVNSKEKDKIAKLVKPILNSAKRIKVMSYATGIDSEVNSSRRISLQRAISIRSYMISLGIDKSRINVQAAGNNAPDEKLANSAHISIME